MVLEDATDRATFFNTAEHGTTAVINSTNVDGVFDNEYAEILDVTGSTPMFICTTADLDAIAPTVDRSTTVAIDGVDYTIEDIQPDGTGMTMLILEKV